MDTAYYAQLKTLGLTKSQIAVYLFLLQNGLSTPPQIAKATGIARTNCYHLLEELINQGLILASQKGKRKAYVAKDPESLLAGLLQKKEVVEQLLPDLRSLYTTQKNKPSIQFYDGWEQMKEIYWQAAGADEMYAIGSTKRLVEIDAAFFKKFEDRLVERGVVLNDIVTHDSAPVAQNETAALLKGLYHYKSLPPQKNGLPTDVLLWDDYIALITLEEPMFGTVLKSPPLANTFRFYFKLMWEGL